MKSKKGKTRSDTSTKSRTKGKRVAKIQNKAAKEGEYQGVAWESGCELACLHWLFTLKKEGYVDSITRCPGWLLSDAVIHNYYQAMKRGSKPMQQTLMQGHSYTGDYMVVFTKKAIDKFIWVKGSPVKFERNLLVAHQTEHLDQYVTYLEVKPDFSFQGKTEKAINDIKWVYQKFGIWVNLFKPNQRFSLTFCPDEYKITERGRARKLPFTPRSLKQYINLLNKP
jgi:DNA modification methylase